VPHSELLKVIIIQLKITKEKDTQNNIKTHKIITNIITKMLKQMKMQMLMEVSLKVLMYQMAKEAKLAPLVINITNQLTSVICIVQ